MSPLVREAVRTGHYSLRTEEADLRWARQYILFCGKRHPAELGASEVSAFISHPAFGRKVAASTQTQALSALLFLHREVLAVCLPGPPPLKGSALGARAAPPHRRDGAAEGGQAGDDGRPVAKPGSCHTFRHSFATHMIEAGAGSGARSTRNERMREERPGIIYGLKD